MTEINKKALKNTIFGFSIMFLLLFYIVGVTSLAVYFSSWFWLGLSPIIGSLFYIQYLLEKSELERNETYK